MQAALSQIWTFVGGSVSLDVTIMQPASPEMLYNNNTIPIQLDNESNFVCLVFGSGRKLQV